MNLLCYCTDMIPEDSSYQSGPNLDEPIDGEGTKIADRGCR